MAKIQYIYTVELPDDQVDKVKQSVETTLAQPMGVLEKQVITQVMAQVIQQVQMMMQKNVGASEPCQKIAQHCCVLGMAATGPSFGFELKVLSQIPQMRQITWEDPT